MKIHFWGVRGSIATPLSNQVLRGKIEAALKLAFQANIRKESQLSRFIGSLPWHINGTVGGDTSCVEISADNQKLIVDAGTGIRPLGMNIMRESGGKPVEAHILISHTHWDHISGFPFFVPAYIPGNKVTLYGGHQDLEDRFKWQQKEDFFPVPLDKMAADIKFVQLEVGKPFKVGDFTINSMPLEHPGGCYSFRIERGGKCVVYATDGEYKDTSIDSLEPVIEFFKEADLLIFDAQYTLLDTMEKEDWGHSSAFIGIDLAIESGVKNIAFVHHEPTYSDEKIWEIYSKSNEYLINYRSSEALKIYLSYEGLSITV